MIVLALDTATEAIALACAREEVDGSSRSARELLGSDDGPAPRAANSQLVPRAKALFDRLGLDPKDIGCVVCGRGPGSFTGVRIGVATAKGIALGLHVPLHGVSTLDAIAWTLHFEGYRGQLAVVDDAMRSEVYPARYELTDADVRRITPDTVEKPSDLAARWASEATSRLLLCGNALIKYRGIFEAAFADAGKADLLEVAPQELWLPQGRGLLAAYGQARDGGRLDSGDVGSLLPIYTRLSDAEENERRRAGAQDAVADTMMAPAIPDSGVADSMGEGGVVLRPMNRNDLPYVASLEKAAFVGEAAADAWSEAMLADELGRRDRHWWVALKRGEVVGYVGGWYIDGQLQILDVATRPGYTREGIAHRLISRVSLDALALGASEVTLEVRRGNLPAQRLYASLGLVSQGIRPHYYPNGEDAVIMTGPLPLTPSEAADPDTAGGEVAPDAAAVGGDAGKKRDVAGMHLQDSVVEDPACSDVAASGPVRPLIFAIESSCDETGGAIIDGDEHLLSDVIASQIDFHARFGGVVPEIASRKHIEAIVGVAEEALARACREVGNPDLDFRDLDAIAVTTCPGLVGALVVGLAFSKGLAWSCGLPLIGVNHLEGHLYANRFITPDIKPPMVALLVSGGNTMLVHVKDWGDYTTLGETLDDAAGEAFDKVAKALGLGYPGGPIISRLAKQGNPKAIDFPRAMMYSHDLRFSLSGLKTAVITYIDAEQKAGRPLNLPDLAASFQQAVIDVQVAKAVTACEQTGVHEFCLGGGVAANPALRAALSQAMGRIGVRVSLPAPSSCTDNAGMIASVALARYRAGNFSDLDIDARAHAPLDERY